MSTNTDSASAPNPDKLKGNLTYVLATVAKQAENEMYHMLEGSRLNVTGYRILASLAAYEALSISDLGRVMKIDRAQISRAAVVLEKDGLVVFEAHPVNRRKKMVRLSAEGQEQLALVRPAFDARRKRLEDALGPQRLHDVLTALRIMGQNLPD